jgi:hypothetical protein
VYVALIVNLYLIFYLAYLCLGADSRWVSAVFRATLTWNICWRLEGEPEFSVNIDTDCKKIGMN